MSLRSYPKINKRSSKRQSVRFKLQFKIAGQEFFPPHTATTLDVSARGLAFFSEVDIPIESRISLELQVPYSSQVLPIKGTIRRIEKGPGDSATVYGMTFDEIDRKAQSLLQQFVQLSDINGILGTAVKKGASDIHLLPGHSPIFRVEGELLSEETFPLTADDLKDLVVNVLSAKQWEMFESNLELDFSYLSQDGVRFRGNVHLEKENVEVSFRVIPRDIRSVAELGLPPIIEDLAKRKKGLILITGPAGSGKSTTLSTMIDLINQQRKCMIISIEDPIEFVHQAKKSIIKQREVGRDTLSFNQALKHVLRQDVDVILVGEMRDVESISMVITAAETGHLVLSTLHTSDTTECLNRIIDAYPEDQQNQVRAQLAGCLEAVITQFLLPRSDKDSRIPATEVLVTTPAIRNLIRTGQLGQIHIYLEAGSTHGMHTMDNSLLDLMRRRVISKETALSYARDFKKIQGSL